MAKKGGSKSNNQGRNIIVVLLTIFILISVVNLVHYFQSDSSAESESSPRAQGEVTLTILSPPSEEPSLTEKNGQE